ncbi:MAG: hypothetical protein Q9162_007249 [Coniocarpon cinnabarinum]
MQDNDHSNVTVSGFVPLYDHSTDPYVNVSTSPVCVNWKVSETRDLQAPVASGTAYTSSDIDFTIKVEASGLSPYTQYYYQFNICNSANNTSPLGRTKTTPGPDDDVDHVGLSVYSCSNFPFGFFNAFGNSARKDSVDYVVHLGDYIYEYKNGDYGEGQTIGRVPQPDKEIYSLYDYRRRFANYREDFDLLLSHQQFPWIPVWDDHEVADNTYRDGSSELNNTEQSFVQDGGVSVDQRKMNSVRAYFEWMPIRQVEMDDNLRIWRSFSIGNLIDLLMLDTRQYDRSITDLYWNTDYVREISNDAGRSMMGSRQENWFYDQLSASAARGATWRLIGSQTVFSRQNESVAYGSQDPFDYDAWDGYLANRNRTLNHLYSNHINNNIMMAGDSHLNWVSDLVWLDPQNFGPNSNAGNLPPYDNNTGAGAIGVEFAGTAVSSPTPLGANVSIAYANNASRALVADNAELQWQEAYYRGYYELQISKAFLNASYFGMPTIVTRNPFEIPLANFSVVSGANALSRPIGGGTVENGALSQGSVVMTNITNDTSIAGGSWFISHDDMEVL